MDGAGSFSGHVEPYAVSTGRPALLLILGTGCRWAGGQSLALNSGIVLWEDRTPEDGFDSIVELLRVYFSLH